MISKILGVALLSCVLQGAVLLAMENSGSSASSGVRHIHVDAGLYRDLVGQEVECLGSLKSICNIDYLYEAPLRKYGISGVDYYFEHAPERSGVTYYGLVWERPERACCMLLHSSWISETGVQGGEKSATLIAGPDVDNIGKKVTFLDRGCPFGGRWGEVNLWKYKDFMFGCADYEQLLFDTYDEAMQGSKSLDCATCVYAVKYEGRFYCLYCDWSPELREEIVPFKEKNEELFKPEDTFVVAFGGN